MLIVLMTANDPASMHANNVGLISALFSPKFHPISGNVRQLLTDLAD